MRKPLLALAAIALTAPGMARDRSQIPEAVPAGRPESCISISRIRASHVHGDGVIDFEMSGKKSIATRCPATAPAWGSAKPLRTRHRSANYARPT